MSDLDLARKTGDTISRLLGMYRITQAELARELHISPQTMTHLVRGQHEGRVSTYRAIFGFFGLHRLVVDFEAALPEIVANFSEVERRAHTIRRGEA